MKRKQRSKPVPSKPVTDAEYAVLEVLWKHGMLTRREITRRLYPQDRESDSATVQKLLERLEGKGYVRRDRSEYTHRLEATCDREQFAGEQLKVVAERLSGGSLTPLLLHLVEREKLTDQERQRIRALLDQDDTPLNAQTESRTSGRSKGESS